MSKLNDFLGKKIDEVICNHNALLKFALENKNIQNTGKSIEKEEFESRDIFIFKYHLDYYNYSKKGFIFVDKVLELKHQEFTFVRVLGVSYEDIDIYPEEQNIFCLPRENENGKLLIIDSELFVENFEKLREIPHESTMYWENYDHSFIEDEIEFNEPKYPEEEIWDDDYPPKSLFH